MNAFFTLAGRKLCTTFPLELITEDSVTFLHIVIQPYGSLQMSLISPDA